MDDTPAARLWSERLLRACQIFVALAAFGIGLDETRAESSPAIAQVVRQSVSNMQNFVIIFRQGPHPLTEADKARRQAEVSAWARVQNAAGHKLEPRILASEAIRPVADATNANGGVGIDAWPITALLFLQASDLAEAAKVAESHPAKHFGVSVEVRPWAAPLVPATVQ